jgi:hypothetical protein
LHDFIFCFAFSNNLIIFAEQNQNIMKTEIQILAYSAAGGNLIWHETMNDFINYERDVPPTDLEELKHAKEKAKQYPAIVNVWAEKIDIETGELIESYF